MLLTLFWKIEIINKIIRTTFSNTLIIIPIAPINNQLLLSSLHSSYIADSIADVLATHPPPVLLATHPPPVLLATHPPPVPPTIII